MVDGEGLKRLNLVSMTADAESQRVANVEGTREATKLAKDLDAKHFHMAAV